MCLIHRFLLHAGRALTLWLGALMHGLAIEVLMRCYPEYDSQWHARSSLTLFGQTLPLHILLLYPVLIYLSVMGVSRLQLRPISEALASALGNHPLTCVPSSV